MLQHATIFMVSPLGNDLTGASDTWGHCTPCDAVGSIPQKSYM